MRLAEAVHAIAPELTARGFVVRQFGESIVAIAATGPEALALVDDRLLYSVRCTPGPDLAVELIDITSTLARKNGESERWLALYVERATPSTSRLLAAAVDRHRGWKRTAVARDIVAADGSMVEIFTDPYLRLRARIHRHNAPTTKIEVM
jgi:hypothetical protein